MTGTALTVLGVALIALVLVDVLGTTWIIGGAGPLTRRVLGPVRRLLLRLHQQDSRSRVLADAGAVCSSPPWCSG